MRKAQIIPPGYKAMAILLKEPHPKLENTSRSKFIEGYWVQFPVVATEPGNNSKKHIRTLAQCDESPSNDENSMTDAI
jgi:hypothetical protein